MSDRREAIARALFERKRKEYDLTTRWEQLDEDDQEHLRNDADAALAAMDAEPTEAEIRDAAWRIVDACEAAVQHSYVDYGDSINALTRGNQYDRLHIGPAIDNLVALIAARKDRP